MSALQRGKVWSVPALCVVLCERARALGFPKAPWKLTWSEASCHGPSGAADHSPRDDQRLECERGLSSSLSSLFNQFPRHECVRTAPSRPDAFSLCRPDSTAQHKRSRRCTSVWEPQQPPTPTFVNLFRQLMQTQDDTGYFGETASWMWHSATYLPALQVKKGDVIFCFSQSPRTFICAL